MNMNNLTGMKIGDLRAFDAVAQTLSFAEAGRRLGRSHPSVFAAVGRLEAQLGLQLLDRRGYRSKLTEAGETFHAHVVHALHRLESLVQIAEELRTGREPSLTVVLGDLTRRKIVLDRLARFFSDCPGTQLNLDYEAVAGPSERVRTGSADLAIHRVDDVDLDLEVLPFERIDLVPVAAAGFFDVAPDRLTVEILRSRAQCVIRDTAKAADQDFFLVEGAPRCTVPDHGMKKDLILQGLAWGHLPDFMVVRELKEGLLVDIRCDILPGRRETIGVMRKRGARRGPVAEELWQALGRLANGSKAKG
jgi:DNA-binding transcriptional LysR family regulator